jgi:transporter family-2 protein
VAILATVLAGAFVALQPPVNSRLGRSVGTVQAATISFVGGLLLLLVAVSIADGGFGAFGRLGRAPWWALIGGLFGAVLVSVGLVAVRSLGASGFTAAMIAGQLSGSLIIDRFGLVGVARQQITAQRLFGVALLAVGVALVVRK